MIRFDSCDQNRLVIIKYTGIIDKTFLISFMEFLYSKVNKELLEKALIDFRDAEIAFNIEDLKEVLMWRVHYSKGFSHSLRSVYVVQEAKETAFTTKYAKDLPQNVATIIVCSTMFYAIRSLDINFSVDEIEDKIKRLSTIFPVQELELGVQKLSE
jgi:hypothetical protein